MQPLSSALGVLILSLALCSFHGDLVHGQDFSFSSGKLSTDSLTFMEHGKVDSTGTLILDASAGDAQAFYSKPINLYSSVNGSLNSFSTFFTFSSNSTSGNGTVAFAAIYETAAKGGLAAARSTFTIEFNTSCSTGQYNGSGHFYGGHAFPGGGDWGGRRGGRRGFRGGFEVVEYANNTAITTQTVSGYGPNWDGQPADGSYFCSQQPLVDLSNPTFQYQVVLEYNASTDTVWVGSPSCGAALARTTQFAASDLSGVLNKPDVYVGFIVTGGGVFNLSQWNFTGNAATSSVSSLALSSTVDTSSGGVSDGGSDGGKARGKELGKGYVIAFSVLGAAIGIGAVAALCCLCAMRRRRRVAASGGFMAKGMHAGTIPESKVVFDAAKPPAAPAKMYHHAERDTTPLNTQPNSAFHASTGGATWLQPVAPR